MLIGGRVSLSPRATFVVSSIFTAAGLPGSLYAFGSVPAILLSVAAAANGPPFSWSAST